MSVNKVILIGNVGKDAEIRYLDGGGAVANFPLATTESYKDKSGQRVDQTEWHNIELWDDLAKIAEKYVKKGKLLYVEGKIRTNSWIDKESGQKKFNRFIRANVMTFIGGASGEGRSDKKPETDRETEERSAGNGGSSDENTGDDLPF